MPDGGFSVETTKSVPLLARAVPATEAEHPDRCSEHCERGRFRNRDDLVPTTELGIVDLCRTGKSGEAELTDPGTHVFGEDQLICPASGGTAAPIGNRQRSARSENGAVAKTQQAC